jgi:hypothetical protein
MRGKLPVAATHLCNREREQDSLTVREDVQSGAYGGCSISVTTDVQIEESGDRAPGASMLPELRVIAVGRDRRRYSTVKILYMPMAACVGTVPGPARKQNAT